MFKKTERLTRSEFSEYFKSGQRHNFKYCTVVTFPLTALKTSVVVGKKVAKAAIKRNTFKRRVYALLRKVVLGSEYQGVVIVILKPTYASLPRKVAEDFLNQSIAQALKSK